MTAEQELKKFLDENPHLKPLQMRLEKDMRSVPPEYRVAVIAQHLAWNLEELDTELKLLQYILKKV